jgi:hypothetical protein
LSDGILLSKIISATFEDPLLVKLIKIPADTDAEKEHNLLRVGEGNLFYLIYILVAYVGIIILQLCSFGEKGENCKVLFRRSSWIFMGSAKMQLTKKRQSKRVRPEKLFNEVILLLLISI